MVLTLTAHAAAPARPNILFIAVDDLRPALGCYGDPQAKTPHIDRLAAQSLVLTRAYCQVPVCGASRASLMTGILPLPNRFTTHTSRADEDAPGAVTLPQVLKDAGYTTLSNGKIFHNSADTRERSWSENPWSPDQGHSTSFDPATVAVKSAAGRPRVYEAPDVPDEAYGDGKTAGKTIADLRRLEAAGKPFFLACGFIRPHLPFYAPKKYWDRYDREKIVLAAHRDRPADAPAGLKGSAEYRSYAHGDYTDGTEAFHRMMRHGYYASTSYVDRLVGNVLAELARLGLADNTIVVLWGDHGWNLGEHDFWGKHNTLDTAVRVPLIVKVPGQTSGRKSDALVGACDLFPTLCALANLPVPATVQGRSFAALVADPQQPFRDSVYTRYAKGDAVVTDRWIYTSYGADGEMLYDLARDPGETRNLAALPEHRASLAALRTRLAVHRKTAASAAVPPPRPPAGKAKAAKAAKN
jgi:arylsulfatase A-like enzyme